jgi:hypothetical protein
MRDTLAPSAARQASPLNFFYGGLWDLLMLALVALPHLLGYCEASSGRHLEVFGV